MKGSEEIKYILTCNLYAGGAETAPPLGTILGNIGVNTAKFCKEFNDYTNELPIYIKLRVTIFVQENKHFKFTINLGSTGFLISLIKIEREEGDQILLSELLMLAKFKFPLYSFKRSFSILLSAIDAANIELIDDYTNTDLEF